MFSCDTQKQQKLHSLLLAPFSLTKHLLVCYIISITYFVMKKKVPFCVINVMLSTTTKLMQQKLFTWK